MKKHASPVRIFVALAALGLAGISAACGEINPARPSSLPGTDILATTEELPEFDINPLPSHSCSEFAVGTQSGRFEAAVICAPGQGRLPDHRIPTLLDQDVADSSMVQVAASAPLRSRR